MKKNILNFIFPLIFILILTFSFYLHYNLRYYLRFGDEIGHFYLGHLILTKKHIYKDILSHHQPIIYLLSAFTELLTKPENLYRYIGYQRMSIFIYSLFWNICYYLFFGRISLIFIFVFEFIKLFYLGFQNLGETLAVYPLIFLFGSIYKNYINKKTNNLEVVFYSLANFFAFFSLAPLWPSLFFLYVIKFFLLKDKDKKILLISSTLFLISILSLFIPYKDYIRETIINNFKYYLPSFKNENNIFLYLTLPFQSFFPPYELINIMISLITLIFIFNLFISYRNNKNIFKILIFFIFIIYLLNFRNQSLKFEQFPKFHILPWIGVYFFVSIFTLNYLKINRNILKIFLTLIILVNIFLIFKNENFYKKRNFLNDFYIGYSQSETYGRIINILKDKNDKLLVIPNDPLVYYLTNINPPIRIVEYYAWMTKISEDNQKLINLFKNTPPEFVVDTGLNENNFLEKYVIDNLNKNYVNLKHLNKKSKLYIYKDKIKEITEKQKEEMSNLLFSF